MQAIPSPLAIGRPIPGATAGSILFAGTSGVLAQDNANLKWGTTAGQGLTAKAGTAASAVSAFDLSQTWNYATAAITGVKWTFTDTSSHANTLAFQILGGAAGATKLFEIGKTGNAGFGATSLASRLNVPNAQYLGFDLAAGTGTAVFMRATSGNAGEIITSGYATSFSINALDVRLNVASGGSVIINRTDVAISAISAGLLGVGTGAAGSYAGSVKLTNTQNVGYQELDEMTAPAGAANSARLFTQDNGAGKTQLMCIFGSGAAIQLAIEV